MKYYFQRVIKHYILVALTSSGANITSDTHVELDAAMEDLVEVIEKTIEQAIKEVSNDES